MDFFTSAYKKMLDAKAAKEQRIQEEARANALEFFRIKFPDFAKALEHEGYTIEGGAVTDMSDMGYPYDTCADIKIIKWGIAETLNSKNDTRRRPYRTAFFSLTLPGRFYGDAKYDPNDYLKFIHAEIDDRDIDPITGITDEMVRFIGKAFSEDSEEEKPYLQIDIKDKSPYATYLFAEPSELPEPVSHIHRDEIAALAMAGILAGMINSEFITRDVAEKIASDSYLLADAMICSRKD